MTIVKKQHYVWQYMLQPWTTDGKIACLRQADKAAFVTGTTSVANETYFYRNNKLSPQDLMYVESIIMRSRHETLRDLNRETVAMFQKSHEMRELAERMPADDPRRAQVEEELAVLDKTLGESYHTLFEGRARRLVDRLKASDCDFYRDTFDAMEFVNFISHQFTRGPKFLSIAMSLHNPIEGLDLKRTWLVESHIYATNIGFSFLAEKDKYKFLFLNNNSSTPFITGDQPLINLNAQTNPDVRMYYPLSPTHAVIYGVDDAIDFCASRDVDEDQAGFLNDRIYAMSWIKSTPSQRRRWSPISGSQRVITHPRLCNKRSRSDRKAAGTSAAGIYPQKETPEPVARPRRVPLTTGREAARGASRYP